MEENTQAKNIYELAVLFVSTIPEEAIAGRFGDLKATLEKSGAVFISEDMPRPIELAYEMSRIIANKKTWFDHGYFGWVKFELDAAQVAEIKPILERNEEIIRFLIVRTVRENTVTGKHVFSTAAGAMRRRNAERKEEAPATPLSKEEIDAQIDALVVEEKVA